MKAAHLTQTALENTGDHDTAQPLEEVHRQLEVLQQRIVVEEALERVRARSMAMHHSEELAEVIKTIYRELQQLGFDALASDLLILDEDAQGFDVWVSGTEGTEGPLRWIEHPHHLGTLEAWKRGDAVRVTELTDEAFTSFLEAVFDEMTGLQQVGTEVKGHLFSLGHMVHTEAFTKHGCIRVASLEPRTEAQLAIQQRFAHVFEQTYTRFLDLKKAEAQAREAQIEAALERVRARTMAMHHSDELADVAVLLFQQLRDVGIVPWRCGFAIIDEATATAETYFTTSSGEVNLQQGKIHFEGYPLFEGAYTAWKHRDPVYSYDLSGEALWEYMQHVLKYTTISLQEWESAKELDLPSRIVFNNITISQGLLVVNTREPLGAEAGVVVQRFAKVFEQTYTRFLDLKKAEEQARESEIQLALERVRARTMAMHKSDELREVVAVVYKQLQYLDFDTIGLGIHLFDKTTGDMESWISWSVKEIHPESYHVPYFEHPYYDAQLKAWREGVPYKTFEFAGALKKSYDRHVFEQSDYQFLDEVKEAVLAIDYGVTSNAFMSHGMLEVIGETPLPDDEAAILKRFARVFEQTYTRFLDLKKAEEQAREAQIEAALERVRARSMAMHKSDELAEVIAVVFAQLHTLGFDLDACSIDIIDDETRDFQVWHASAHQPQIAGSIFIPASIWDFDHPLIARAIESLAKGETFYTDAYSREEKNRYYQWLFEYSDLKHIPEERKTHLMESPGLARSLALTKHGNLAVYNSDGEPFSEEENTILRRFARVFEQTYTRFLDLKKAEEQVREAQIEAALERVRARSMAMHHSNELREVVAVFYEQLQPFGLATWGCEIIICDEPTGSMEYWFSDVTQQVLPKCYSVSFSGHPILEKQWNAWQEGVPLLTTELASEEKRRFDQYLFEETSFKSLPEAVKTVILGEDFVVFSQITMKHGLLGAIDVEPISDEKTAILRRFARVFEQTYTRFLDLKKAEEQVREAQIEAALERVRARTMGMHHSDELAEVIAVVFAQLQTLGIEAATCSLEIIPGERQVIYTWFATSHQPEVAQSMYMPLSIWDQEHRFIVSILEAWRKQEPFYTDIFLGEEKDHHYRWLFEQTDAKHMPEERKAYIMASPGVARSVATTRHGNLVMYNLEADPFSEEENTILKRFAHVFEQTYTRFLDLKQAEEQAREAQIEAALERVRARSMAMHKSDELAEVIAVVFAQLHTLGFDLDGCSIDIIDEKTRDIQVWHATTHQPQIAGSVFIPASIWDVDHPLIARVIESLAKEEAFYTEVYSREEKNRFYQWLFEHSDLKHTPEERKIYIMGGKGFARSLALTKHGNLVIYNHNGDPLSENENAILQRFARVFEQTYTRFLDLQKAEAQAREAQIEAALERVRARTMAMHHSEDVASATVVLFDELNGLGVTSLRCGIAIPLDSNTIEFWAAASTEDGASIRVLGSESLNLHPALQSAYDAWKRQESHHLYILQGEDLAQYYRAVLQTMPLPEWQERMRSISDGREDFSTFRFSDGWVYIFTSEPLSGEAINILLRFAQVFDLTYRRFLDLKKAEEQAREAQIEAALERVRAKAMAMHHSDDLATVATTVFDQLNTLDIDMMRCAVGLFDEATREAEFRTTTTTDEGDVFQIAGRVLASVHPKANDAFEAWQRQDDFYCHDLSGEALKQYLIAISPEYPVIAQTPGATAALPDREVFHLWPSPEGGLVVVAEEPLSEEAIRIMRRFTDTFSFAYTRFLELKQAEEQAREAQIEVALERVRARTMAMHKSDELREVVATVYEQLQNLAFDSWMCGIGIIDGARGSIDIWMSNEAQSVLPEKYHMPPLDHPIFQGTLDAWQQGIPYRVVVVEGAVKASYDRLLLEETDWKNLPEPIKHGMRARERVVLSDAFMRHGVLEAVGAEPLPDDKAAILQRFARVFEQTYTRFLDLKQAEEQAREAQIEAALERVRSRAIAMQHSGELAEISFLLDAQVRALGIKTWGCAFHIYQDNEALEWFSNENGVLSAAYRLPREDIWLRCYEAGQRGETLYIEEFEGEDCVAHYEYLCTIPGVGDDLLKIKEAGGSFPTFQIDHAAFFKYGHLLFITFEPVPEAHDAFKRFAKAFEQAYTRFLDLKQAEAQAREAQIEAALERVRARAMAMHSSDELRSIIASLFEQLKGLSFDTSGVSFVIFNKTDKSYIQWMSGFGKELYAESYHVPYFDHPYYNAQIEGWQQGEKYSEFRLDRALKDSYGEFVFEHSDLKKLPQEVKDAILFDDVWIMCNAFMSHGAIEAVAGAEPLSEGQADILQRFAAVFDQTYTRFLDLQKAEAQAREAQIEAALERVRAKAMAMHHSDELHEVITIIFEQLHGLGIDSTYCEIGIFDAETRASDWWHADATAPQPQQYHVPYLDGTWFKNAFNTWQQQLPYVTFTLEGEEKQHSDYLFLNFTDYKDMPEESKAELVALERMVFAHASFNHGLLEVLGIEAISDEKATIIQRFANVLDLTYTRFDDLQQAEARAREAVRDASLDRVRAEIASMRTADDLQRITPLVWRELTTLGVPFFRCGVFIIDEAHEQVHTYLTTPEGQSIAVLHLPFDSADTTREAVVHWRNRHVYTDLWDRQQFMEWIQTMTEQGHIDAAEAYQAAEEPPESLALQFVPFTQGMLYVGSEAPLSKDEIDLVQALADAFAVAYARYEDFTQLEATLADLKATQNQLIHAEKMASLGQMTAGIAHEIKNPLNFVNNFAELNTELTDEIFEDLEADPDLRVADIQDLLEDMKLNASHIAKHGKRADGIVRGMMQHARGSEGDCEATDVNAFVEEYFNLAYHGMRASQPGFNATLERDYEKALGTVEMVPQEMGRVLINLLSNAFYAVRDKEQRINEAYAPTVRVRTSMKEDQVEIRIEDNGPGISEDIREKIFEPFYTTKPTGQGNTGLGLSLSYDIVTQMHGGTLAVESIEGEGATFIITLPDTME